MRFVIVVLTGIQNEKFPLLLLLLLLVSLSQSRLSIFPSVHLAFLATPAAHSSTCVTLCPLIINRNAISSPNLQASPFAPHTIYSAVETKLGLIQSYSPFNIFFSFLITTIVIVLFVNTGYPVTNYLVIVRFVIVVLTGIQNEKFPLLSLFVVELWRTDAIVHGSRFIAI